MEKKYFTNAETIAIGCIVFIIAYIVPALWSQFGLYFFMAAPLFLLAMLPPILVGLIIGRYYAKTPLGTWLGAILGAIVGEFLCFSLAARLSFG